MTYEEYENLPQFLEFAKVGNTLISLAHNPESLTEESKSFFEDKVILVPKLEKLDVMIKLAFDPFTDSFDFRIIEENVLRELNGTLHTALEINIATPST
ncbi:hypothetical protein ACFSQ3_14570 [Sphingobacterium corticis]|uniref:Uncharacterized protein n=1 Tax=Sphingobacterium corticis TaxID=1812823 RepID=A0ABW5NQ10_9SPHI